MKRHPEIGARILDHAGLADIASWVRARHERIDGRGYPLGLAAPRDPRSRPGSSRSRTRMRR
jgi:HD-GYP domain-containing protein (c-di-GMP phosphodiesterase class II)